MKYENNTDRIYQMTRNMHMYNNMILIFLFTWIQEGGGAIILQTIYCSFKKIEIAKTYRCKSIRYP